MQSWHFAQATQRGSSANLSSTSCAAGKLWYARSWASVTASRVPQARRGASTATRPTVESAELQCSWYRLFTLCHEKIEVELTPSFGAWSGHSAMVIARHHTWLCHAWARGGGGRGRRKGRQWTVWTWTRPLRPQRRHPCLLLLLLVLALLLLLLLPPVLLRHRHHARSRGISWRTSRTASWVAASTRRRRTWQR